VGAVATLYITLYFLVFWGSIFGDWMSRQPAPHYNSEGKRETF
jgi:hypothetical protein